MKIIFNFFHHNRHLMAKYAVVGFTGAVVDFGLLYILTEYIGWHYLLSATVSFIFAASVNYNLNRTWTFKSKGKKRKQLPIFFIIATMGIIINNNILYVGVEYFALYYLWAKVFAAAIVMVWNFLGNKFLTFRT